MHEEVWPTHLAEVMDETLSALPQRKQFSMLFRRLLCAARLVAHAKILLQLQAGRVESNFTEHNVEADRVHRHNVHCVS